MRSKSRTSSSKSCESRTGNLAATDASAPNFPDPSAADDGDREGSFRKKPGHSKGNFGNDDSGSFSPQILGGVLAGTPRTPQSSRGIIEARSPMVSRSVLDAAGPER